MAFIEEPAGTKSHAHVAPVEKVELGQEIWSNSLEIEKYPAEFVVQDE